MVNALNLTLQLASCILFPWSPFLLISCLSRCFGHPGVLACSMGVNHIYTPPASHLVGLVSFLSFVFYIHQATNDVMESTRRKIDHVDISQMTRCFIGNWAIYLGVVVILQHLASFPPRSGYTSRRCWDHLQLL